MPKRTVYAVTSFDRGGNSGYVVECLFERREDAERYVAQDTNAGKEGWAAGHFEIEELDLFDSWETSLEPYSYWHRGASVYPDKTVDDWTQEHRTEGPREHPAVDDHLEPWDGHTQGHCGLHISIFGTDRDALEQAFQAQLNDALAKTTGTCPSCGRTGPFKTDFWSDPEELIGWETGPQHDTDRCTRCQGEFVNGIVTFAWKRVGDQDCWARLCVNCAEAHQAEMRAKPGYVSLRGTTED